MMFLAAILLSRITYSEVSRKAQTRDPTPKIEPGILAERTDQFHVAGRDLGDF